MIEYGLAWMLVQDRHEELAAAAAARRPRRTRLLQVLGWEVAR
jgi:hypothetical protein